MIEWRQVAGAEGRYEVSSDGRVWSAPRPRTRGGLLKLTPRKEGYLTVVIDRRTRDVHVLVAEAFHGPRPSPEHESRHLNGNQLDNDAENLRWGTKSENRHDSVQHGTHANAAKEACPADHPYDEENTLILSSGERRCRRCNTSGRALKRRSA